MENSIDKLTNLQKEFGYKEGEINAVALLGLFGEAGEVMNECKHKSLINNDLLRICPNAVEVAKGVDDFKKEIRSKSNTITIGTIVIENEEKFDKEMADVLYYLNVLALNRGKTLNDYAEISYQKVMSKKKQ